VTIWKFPLQTTDFQVISLPIGHRILCVQVQGGTPCLWAQVDPERDSAQVGIRIYGTGHQVHRIDQSYIGTYQLNDGRLVFHVFEVLG